MSQLTTFLTSTSAGKKLLAILRNGAVEQGMRCMTGETADRALYLAGCSAGYTAAVAVLDELSGAHSQAEDATADNPLDFGIVR